MLANDSNDSKSSYDQSKRLQCVFIGALGPGFSRVKNEHILMIASINISSTFLSHGKMDDK